jgi:hypothetical protein
MSGENALLALRDQIHTLEAANAELKRLLHKETRINAVLIGSEPSCKQCAAFESVRQDNAQEFRWVEHFQKISHNLQSQLQEKLTRVEAAFAAAKLAKAEDPLSRDAEILRLREGFAEAKRDWANANQTALQANKVSDALASQLDAAKDRIRSLEADLAEAAGTIKQHEVVWAAPFLPRKRVFNCAARTQSTPTAARRSSGASGRASARTCGAGSGTWRCTRARWRPRTRSWR